VLVALASQNAGKVVLIHEVALSALPALLFSRRANVLLLVLGEDELRTPTALTAATFPFSVGSSVDGLGDAEDITPVVPLHVLLQVHIELAIGSGGA